VARHGHTDCGPSSDPALHESQQNLGVRGTIARDGQRRIIARVLGGPHDALVQEPAQWVVPQHHPMHQ
jgi:hypothetical protein